MATDERLKTAGSLARDDCWRDLFPSVVDPTRRLDPKSITNGSLDWYSIGKEAGESGVDSKTVQTAVEDYYKAVSSADKAKRGNNERAEREKERWSRLNYKAILAEEQAVVKLLREETDERNSKSRISRLLTEAASLDTQVNACESRLDAISREDAAARIKGEASAANDAYLRRLKRVIGVTAAGDAAITIFLTSDYLVVGSFDTLVDAYGKGNWAELIIRSAGLLLLSFIPYVLSIAVKGMADHDKSGAARRKIEWISIILGGLFFGGAALSYFFDANSKPPLGWSIFASLSTLFSTISIFGLTTGLVVVGGLAAHYYFAGTQHAKLGLAESAAIRQRLLEQREQITKRQSAMKERRVAVLGEIQKKRSDLSDAIRKLAEANARLENQRSAAYTAASNGGSPPAMDVEEVQKGAAALALLGWLVGVTVRVRNSSPEQSAEYDRKRLSVERKIAGHSGHK